MDREQIEKEYCHIFPDPTIYDKSFYGFGVALIFFVAEIACQLSDIHKDLQRIALK